MHESFGEGGRWPIVPAVAVTYCFEFFFKEVSDVPKARFHTRNVKCNFFSVFQLAPAYI